MEGENNMSSDNLWLTVMGLIIIISIVGLLIAKKIKSCCRDDDNTLLRGNDFRI